MRYNCTLITYKKETKSLAEWARDSRCKVSYDTLCTRVSKLNWEFGKALLKMPVENYKNYIGQKFNRLKILKIVKRHEKYGNIYLCQCDCAMF